MLGDTIDVILDMGNGTLSFKHNGVSMGVAFTGLSGKLYPAVAFYNRGQRVILDESSFCCPGTDIDNRVRKIHVNRFASSSNLLSRFVRQGDVGKSVLQECYSEHERWLRGKSCRVVSCDEVDVQLDISNRVCSIFGVSRGDIMSSPRGRVSVLGVSKCGELWVQQQVTEEEEEDEVGEKDEEEKEEEKQRQQQDSRVFCFAMSYVLRGRDRFRVLKRSASSDEKNIQMMSKWTMSEEDFSSSLRAWNKNLDLKLVRVVNETRQNPWNMSEDFFKTLSGRFGGIDLRHLLARLSLLRLLNDRIRELVPFGGYRRGGKDMDVDLKDTSVLLRFLRDRTFWYVHS